MSIDPKWKQTVDDALTNKMWDNYDAPIKTEVDEYNRRLAMTPQFISLNWLLFKAMVWVESGGPSNAAWTTRPMQIGNAGDPGYQALKNGEGASSLIMSDTLKQEIKTGNINLPTLNIRAGIAYALTRLSRSDIGSVDDLKDTTVREYSVVHGDSLSGIAAKVGSTLVSIKKLNPTVHVLKTGQKLKYRKASMGRIIIGWRPASSASMAERYNAGDASYKEKLDYVLGLFAKLKR